MKNTVKTLFIILSILTTGATLAVEHNVAPYSRAATDVVGPPNIAAFNIMTNALFALKKLRDQKRVTPENIEALIKAELLPYIAIDVAVRLTLKEHWSALNNQQKKAFQQYITKSLINDYAGILSTYDQLNNIKISTDPKIKRKGNKAIIKLFISFDKNQNPLKVTLKMIRLNHWRVYDLVFSGVSLIKNYKAQFSSHIKRKGLNSLIKKINKKLKNV